MFLSHEMKCYLQCRRQILMCYSFFAEQVMLELQCTESLVLELLRTLMLCLVQLSRWRESKATDHEKLLSQWEKVAKCNLRVMLKYMKDVSFSWNLMLFGNVEDRFSCVRAFYRASHVRASMHRITSLELLRTLKLCLMQLRKWRECKATDAESFFSARESC